MSAVTAGEIQHSDVLFGEMFNFDLRGIRFGGRKKHMDRWRKAEKKRQKKVTIRMVGVRSRGSRVCGDYPEGTNCSGVRQGDAASSHPFNAHQEPDTNSGPDLRVCVCQPRQLCTTTHPPRHTTTPEDPIWNQSTASTGVPVSPSYRVSDRNLDLRSSHITTPPGQSWIWSRVDILLK